MFIGLFKNKKASLTEINYSVNNPCVVIKWPIM